MVTIANLRKIALSLPEVEEKPSHGIPTFRVRNKLFASLREELNSVAIKLDFDDRDSLIAAQPKVFYTNDHYRSYPMVLAHLSEIPTALLRELLSDAWRRVAPKKLAAKHE